MKDLIKYSLVGLVVMALTIGLGALISVLIDNTAWGPWVFGGLLLVLCSIPLGYAVVKAKKEFDK